MSKKKYYVSLDKLSVFLSNLEKTFANISHTHTLASITDFDVDDIVSQVIAQLPSAEGAVW